MKKKQIKKVTDFLGVKVLSPLQEKKVVGGKMESDHVGHKHDTENGNHHTHNA